MSYTTRLPDFTKYFPISRRVNDIAKMIPNINGAYPQKSKYVNMQHYYQNRDVLLPYVLNKQPHPVSLKQLALYYDDDRAFTSSKIIQSANFVRNEIIIRIAHKIFKLQNLPFELVNNYHLVQVYESYYDIFDRFRRLPEIKSLQDNDKFVEFANGILSDYNVLNLPHLIMGALESRILNLFPQAEMDELLSELLRARISRRLMVEEHLSLTSNFSHGREKNRIVFGDIFKTCNAKEYLLNASKMCEDFVKIEYGPTATLPDFIIEGDDDLSFFFLPGHLTYLLGEILRNSYEATIKEAIRKGLHKPDRIKVTIVRNEQSHIFRISDRGGGVVFNHNATDSLNLWSFGKSVDLAKKSLDNFHKLPEFQSDNIYEARRMLANGDNGINSINSKTTFENTSLSNMIEGNLGNKGNFYNKYESSLIDMLKRLPRYKLGVGLALCKVYADYWNGDLNVHSIDGYGTDTVLKLGNLMYLTDKLQLDKV
ncbi:protein kinase PKP2 SCDLUD_000981 [Saccharomycodes ludwigii]|uniref:protein kinase PKP2 n=1 Tax=Saccharomycodes ludwigii TaxID=36035 RepID=UPI001E8C0A43|nr:hypothetical protein SCDLUD_000981 [Saccharomycodes ludwigii]KAH3903352.1 hypothetical protein SCDLUD_000981 [Saccharomycodes ludwigii]